MDASSLNSFRRRAVSGLEVEDARLLAGLMLRLEADAERLARRGHPVNAALEVEPVGFRTVEGRLFGAVVSPVSLELVILPGAADDWSDDLPKASYEIEFPSGGYLFFAAPPHEGGPFRVCPILTSMAGFASQQQAVAVASRLVEQVLAPSGGPGRGGGG